MNAPLTFLFTHDILVNNVLVRDAYPNLLPRQVFFPMAGRKDGWNKLSKNLKATLNEDRLAAYHGTVSLPFAAVKNRKAAMKLIDDRVESLKILPLA